jgi:hypothetical protein
MCSRWVFLGIDVSLVEMRVCGSADNGDGKNFSLVLPIMGMVKCCPRILEVRV